MQKREGVSLRQEIEGSRSRGTVRNFDDRACYGVGLPTDPRARPHYVFLVGLSQPRASPGSLDGPARCRAWGRHGLRTKAKPLVVLPHLAGGFAVSETALGVLTARPPNGQLGEKLALDTLPVVGAFLFATALMSALPLRADIHSARLRCPLCTDETKDQGEQN